MLITYCLQIISSTLLFSMLTRYLRGGEITLVFNWLKSWKFTNAVSWDFPPSEKQLNIFITFSFIFESFFFFTPPLSLKFLLTITFSNLVHLNIFSIYVAPSLFWVCVRESTSCTSVRVLWGSVHLSDFISNSQGPAQSLACCVLWLICFQIHEYPRLEYPKTEEMCPSYSLSLQLTTQLNFPLKGNAHHLF